MIGRSLDEPRLRRLIEAGADLVAQLDLEEVLQSLVSVASELTGARYVALGVLDAERRGLERFITWGVDEDTRREIGQLPRGRGILGLLIEDPRPLRLTDIGEHPRSYGFPAGHPPMRGFLGVPVLIRGEAWGNLYLTEKEDGADFTAEDEETVVVLAHWAAIAVENAGLYESAERRRSQLERAVAEFEATTAITLAIGGETRLDRVLELIVKRARALVDASSLLILLDREGELVVAAAAGHVDPAVVGRRIDVAGTVTGAILRSQRPQRISDPHEQLQASARALGIDANGALLVPLVFRGTGHGVLAAYDRVSGGPQFSVQDERLMLSFAASAATAVATARSVVEDRLRHSIESSDQERRRWARELHDETLQVLGGRQLLLSSALRNDDLEGFRSATAAALDQVKTEIDGLRALITELRPAELDELGLGPAIEQLADRAQATQGLVVEREVALERRLGPELESTVYRLVQEGLANVAKHARAETARVRVSESADGVAVEVRDDGVGIGPAEPSRGFGLQGMRERVQLAGGSLAIENADPGTRVRAVLPARR